MRRGRCEREKYRKKRKEYKLCEEEGRREKKIRDEEGKKHSEGKKRD